MGDIGPKTLHPRTTCSTSLARTFACAVLINIVLIHSLLPLLVLLR